MKRLLLFVLTIGLGVSVFGQYRPIQRNLNVIGTQSARAIDNFIPGDKPANIYVSNKSVMEDPQPMMTNYDLMTNGSMGQSRLYYWPDGTMAATATWGQDEGSTWADRGTGYNYFDGTTWGTPPTARVESLRTGWPSIQPLGPGGEGIVSHQSGTTPLVFSTRATKGTGAWTQTTLPIATGASGMLWPRMLTTGVDHMTVHIIAMTAPTGNGGTLYNGMDGALLYVRSTDGGITWGPWEQLNGMTSADYLSFSGDDYCWANPRGDVICFSVSNAFMDTFIMKSTDAGTTWTKTVVLASDYNLVGVSGVSNLRYYTSDNTSAVALDMNGKAHVTFGLMADSLSGTTSYNYWPYTDGIVYWNESMPTLTSDITPETLYNNGNLIGWATDTMIFYDPYVLANGYRASGISSMPTMTVDENNYLLIVWTCPTTLSDPDTYMYRHLFERTAKIETDNVVWRDSIYSLNTDFLYNFAECVYPTMAMNTSETQFFVEFMQDDYAGTFLSSTNTGYTGQTGVTDNYMTVMSIDKPSVGVGISEQKKDLTSFEVSGNYPNPFSGTTSIGIVTKKAGNLNIDVTNLTGQKVISINKGYTPAGSTRYSIDCSQLSSGVYFYTVTINNESITNKMIVK